MPTVLRWRGYRFFFYSADVGGPPHVHVHRAGKEAKLWLETAAVAVNAGFSDRELATLRRVVSQNRELMERAWHDHFGA